MSKMVDQLKVGKRQEGKKKKNEKNKNKDPILIGQDWVFWGHCNEKPPKQELKPLFKR